MSVDHPLRCNRLCNRRCNRQAFRDGVGVAVSVWRCRWIILGVLGQHDSQPSEDTACLVHISAGDGGTQVVQHVLLRRRRRQQRDSRLLNRAGPCFAARVAHARAVAVLERTGGARPNHSNVPPSFVGQWRSFLRRTRARQWYATPKHVSSETSNRWQLAQLTSVLQKLRVSLPLLPARPSCSGG